MRKFLTFDGELLEETEWSVRATDKCFYCGMHFAGLDLYSDGSTCWDSQDGSHDWITLVKPL